MTFDDSAPDGCSEPGCCTSVTRRQALAILGAGTIAIAAPSAAMAGPFTTADFERLVPADKKLDPAWVKSLFERGTPTVYGGSELDKIGMPIGGICAGQLYLGGDGKLWHWDIFNKPIATGAEHYAAPMQPSSPLEQEFMLELDGAEKRPLDRRGFSKIEFRGAYPMATVNYADSDCPLTATLSAFSPFIPLNTLDSSFPATVMSFTLKNVSDKEVHGKLTGTIENAICLDHPEAVRHEQETDVGDDLTVLEWSAWARGAPKQRRDDILFEDWHGETYDGWTVEGSAFGKGPVARSAIPKYQGDVGGPDPRVVNSHATAPGSSAASKDKQLGKLTSKPFTTERNFLQLWVGGGSHQGKTCVNLLVDGKAVASVTGDNNNRMSLKTINVAKYAGRQARLEIVDAEAGAWGNIGVGRITHTDSPPDIGPVEKLPDFGTLAIAIVGAPEEEKGEYFRSYYRDVPTAGGLSRTLALKPGESATVTFIVSWHFPNLELAGLGRVGRHYATRFGSAKAVAQDIARDLERLTRETQLWHDTWYDSTLPYWFLDRTMLNTSILATSTCHRFTSGRFYGWEGVGCCPGTCAHVWHYAQAVARLHPELERSARTEADFGAGFDNNTGRIRFRAEYNDHWAVDGQAGSILRAYREHQMSADASFLTPLWPKVKKAIEFLMQKDPNGDGIIEGPQHNTLDADWYGSIAWLSGLYLVALSAGEQMANDLQDKSFAEKCRSLLERGREKIGDELFNGEYFANKVDPQHLDAINSGTGCEIDQVFGQHWSFQLSLEPPLFPVQSKSALRSLWKYNFTPDVGPYRKANPPGRWYAMPGEAGLLMCTFPRSDWSYSKAAGKGPDWAAGYFNECMNGFEYQVAGHMLWEGLMLEGMAVTRAVHDRYAASRRNPWNEVECGDHYARSMASYGVYLAACGFEYHGPRGDLAFAPRIKPEDFQAAFTGAEGWGSFRQKISDLSQTAEVALKYGKLRLNTLGLQLGSALAKRDAKKFAVSAKVGAREIPLKHSVSEDRVTFALNTVRVTLTLNNPLTINAGETLTVTIQ